jgi:flavorubredoxin
MDSPSASIEEIAPSTYRVSVALPPSIFAGGFSFNQYLLKDERPLIFHTGPKKMFPLVREQIEKVMPLSDLRYIAFSHFEADECGALAHFLDAAPSARPVCSRVAALVSVNDLVDVEPMGMDQGDSIDLGRREVVWQSTPHLPHGWECGYLFDRTHHILLCGDLFTQPGTGESAITSKDILGPSESFRQSMDYFAHSRDTPQLLDRLAALNPGLLACMHGSAWSGDGARLLLQLRDALTRASNERRNEDMGMQAARTAPPDDLH